MTDFGSLLSNLRRPRLLIRAARLGLQDYRRERDLRRLVAGQTVPESALSALFGQEESLEARRQAGDAGYSLSRHVEVLIALMAEVRLLSRGSVSA